MSVKNRGNFDYRDLLDEDADDFGMLEQASRRREQPSKPREGDGRHLKDRGNPHREAARRKQANRYS